ncbi:MAG: chemotaxis protein MotB [Planctomycetota bacterium]|jgi:chemotaxis protein MotB
MFNTIARLRSSAPRALRLALVSSLLVGLSSSCVTQTRYDEAVRDVKLYQRSYEDLDSAVEQLQARLAAQDAELSILREGGQVAMDAGYNGDIDERLAELRSIMARLGGPSSDVEVLEVEGGYGLRLSDSILFESGQASLRPEGRDLVLSLAVEMRSNPFTRVEVRGHTDSVPVKKPETLQRYPHGNLQLSAARAIEVAALLTGEGQLPTSKVVVSGYGPGAPLVGNDTAENRQRNRRVELIILD